MSRLQDLIDRLPISDDERAELRREVERAGLGCDCLDSIKAWFPTGKRFPKMRKP